MTDRSSNEYLVLFALWLMVFSASSQVIIISPILPRIGEALAVRESLLGTLVTSYAVMLSIFALITGPISDKFGRRRILLAGTGFMAVALYLHAVADSYLSLLVMRALAGAAGGTLSGAAVAYVGDYFPYDRRGWANGWVMSGIAFGQIIGIPLGTLLAELINYRWPFLMFAITMTGAFVLIWRVVPQPDVHGDQRSLSFRRAIVDYGRLLRNPVTGSATVVYFLMFFSIGLYVIYLPTWIERTLGVSGEAIASLFLFGGIANVLTGPAAGKLSDRLGRKPLIIGSCVGLAVVMVLTTYLVSNMWMAYLLFSLAMVMIAMRISPLQSLLSALVTADRRGILMSLAVAVGQVGIGISGALAGPAYGEYGYISNTMLASVAITLMALLVWKALPEPGGELEMDTPEEMPVQTDNVPVGR
ncbi:MAG: MFS transporter [Rhodothermales bacterium]